MLRDELRAADRLLDQEPAVQTRAVPVLHLGCTTTDRHKRQPLIPVLATVCCKLAAGVVTECEGIARVGVPQVFQPLPQKVAAAVHRGAGVAKQREARSRSAIAQDEEGWLGVFGAVRDYVFVALCDADCCGLAIEVLRRMVFESSLGESIFSEGTLLGSLRPALEAFAGRPARARRDPRARREAAEAALEVVARYVADHHVVAVRDDEYGDVPDEP